jgi:tRNA (mo5U34)-methyltransferase
MKRRGASGYLALIRRQVPCPGRFAAQVLNADIEFRNLSVYDVANLGEKFDLVIFMGVFYHLATAPGARPLV